MEERKLCEDCGTKLAPDATSCPTCGLDLEVQGQWEERVTETMVEEAFPLPPEHARGGDVDERRGRIGSRDYASFGARLAAYILDTILTTAVNYGLQVAALIALSVLLGSDLGLDDDGLVQGDASEGMMLLVGLGVLGLSFLVPLLYFALMESSSMQATLGKKLVGIKVTDARGDRISFWRAVGRYLGKIVSTMTLMIGFLMAAFTKKRQALHDMIASTLVLRG